jgi:nucleolar MIF4G domain-containing protein 1
MSSRDVSDAFERLARLALKGKQDREIIRVLVECCAHEKTYNPFYAELSSLLCSQNRQFKTTAQFCFWDVFKGFTDDHGTQERRVINLARMLCRLVCDFHVSVAVIKPLDIRNLNDTTALFLSTLLLSMFSPSVKDETFQQVVDRIATSKDFDMVREILLFFLQTHLKSIPSGIDEKESFTMAKRRRWMLKTLEAMSVIDMVRGEAED